MKIEAGKFYRTRDGRKARVYAVDGGGEFPVHAAIWFMSAWYVSTYNTSGRCNTHDDDDGDGDDDLIAEWVDRPVVDWSKMAAWHRWVAMDARGKWFAYDERPKLNVAYWWGAGSVVCEIPPQHYPTFSGNWKDSLVERPTE